MATADELFDSASDADKLFDEADSRPAPIIASPTADPSVGDSSDSLDPSTQTGAALRGFGQGASYGFSDELGGVVGKGVQAAGGALTGLLKTGPGRALLRKMVPGFRTAPDAAVDAAIDAGADESAYAVLGLQPRATGGKGMQGSAYESVRDQMRRENTESAESQPATYLAANVAGGLAAPGPKGGKMKVGGAVLKPWVARALTGAGVGGLAGLGLSEGETAGDVAADTATSAAFGGIAAPVLGAVSDEAGGAFARWLEKRSRINALKSLGLEGGITNKAKQLGYEGLEELESLGAKMRDEGDIIKPFRTPDAVAQRVEGALEESANAKQAAIDEIERMAQEQGRKFDFNRLAQRAEETIKPAGGWDPLSRETAKKALEMMGQASAAEGGFPMAEQVRRAAGKRIPWKAPAFGQALPDEVASMRKAYGGIADEILEQAKDVEARNVLASGKTPGPEDLGASNQIAAMNSRISSLMDAKALANEQALREAARNSLGLTDKMLGLTAFGGLAAGGHGVAGALAGAALSGASNIARNRLPSAMTYLQHSASKALPVAAKALETPAIRSVAGAGGQAATANAYQSLMQRFGIAAKSKEELADEAFLAGQSE